MAHEAGHNADIDTGRHDGQRLNSDYWMQHRDKLFLASRIALIVTAMSFAIRGDIMGALEGQFHLSAYEVGVIAGTAFWGFTLAMMIGGPLCDVLGMGRLLTVAVIGHAVGIITTIFATGYWGLFMGTLAIGLANGFVEAACNPLIATLYPDQKIKRLSLFHVWFPGGIVIGGIVSYVLTQAGVGWQVKMATMLIPLVVYGIMFLGKKFPATERAASGVSMGQMFSECLRPGFLLFVICMLMTAATELGTTQWIPNIMTVTTGVSGILYLVWINGLMAVGRTFAGELVHRVSPIGMLIVSAVFSAIGVFMLSTANGAAIAFAAATIFAVGVCFFWPTMLGVVSERFPKTGALGLAVMGGAGMLSTSLIIPKIGATYDKVTAATAGGADALKSLQAAAAKPGATDAMKKLADAQATGGTAALQQMFYLPLILTAIFVAIYLYDKSRGGYKEEVLIQEQAVA